MEDSKNNSQQNATSVAGITLLLTADITKMSFNFPKTQEKTKKVRESILPKWAGINSKYNSAINKIKEIETRRLSIVDKIKEKKQLLTKTAVFKKISISIQIAGLEKTRAAIDAEKKIAESTLNTIAKDQTQYKEKFGDIYSDEYKPFYIKSFAVQADTSTKDTLFVFKIEFVALGKTYKVPYNAGKKFYIFNELDNLFLDTITKDMDNLLAEFVSEKKQSVE